MPTFTDDELDSYLVGRAGPSREQLRFLTQGWNVVHDEASGWSGAQVRARRRTELAARMSDTALVIPSGHPARRCADLFYPFRPGSDFTWLVGDDQPGSVLIIDEKGSSTLYRDERPSLGHPLALLDGQRGALWDGEPEPAEAVSARLGVRVRPLSDLNSALEGLIDAKVLSELDPDVDAALPQSDDELGREIARARLIKDDHEIALLRHIAEDTVTAFNRLGAALPAAVELGEAHLEGVFLREARTYGYGPAYNPVVGAGANGTVLHWMRNDGSVGNDDLVLIDAGIEGRERYATDVTRTLPVSGQFTSTQRQVYDIVFDAQEAALAEVRPGVNLRDLHGAARAVICEGLRRLGVLREGFASGLTDEEAVMRWMPHGIGHMLGVDVHDCLSVAGEWMSLPLQPGHVITVEPGLYLSPHDELVPEHLRGIGVRIEDDLIVTADGYENLTAGLPRSSAEVELWLAHLQDAEVRP